MLLVPSRDNHLATSERTTMFESAIFLAADKSVNAWEMANALWIGFIKRILIIQRINNLLKLLAELKIINTMFERTLITNARTREITHFSCHLSVRCDNLYKT
jgi:hypothetical protein